MDSHGSRSQDKVLRAKRASLLVVLSVMEIGGRAMSTLIAQPLKFHVAGGNVPLSIPMMHSMLESGSFILSLLAWVSFSLYRRGRVTIDNWRYRVKVYALMGLLDCVSGVSGSIGLNILPASIFTLLGSTAIVFSIILSRVFTNKKFTLWHYAAVVLTVSSVVFLFASMDDTTRNPRDVVISPDAILEQPVSQVVAFLCCLMSAFLIALIGVLNYVFFKHEQVKYDLAIILENNAIQSTFVFAFLLPVVLSSKEFSLWGTVYKRIQLNGQTPLFTGVCVGIFLSRPLTLFSSVATTAFSSAVLTRALGGPRRLVVMVMSALIFGDPMPALKLLSAAFMFFSTLIYVVGGYKLQKQEALQKSATRVEMVKITPDAGERSSSTSASVMTRP
ncbi:Sugar phosphate transporter domain-containing protein [Plasmodiophora brassicae]|uniref:Sugar phosphate transporter domain-containing protein n=1 Tax=Plasmodiophora brassicae TaxID=37360 RepID=A0A0G4J833_PLABS|nr:hypothetical protein PBRA_003211 [Plasmodiophora brassicae]